MKYSNDYKIVVENKYYAIFTDGEGNEQKVEVTQEVADAIIKEQRAERALVRKNERHTISLESLDYGGEIFAIYDDYSSIYDNEELSNEEKVKMALEQLKPQHRDLLLQVYSQNKTQAQIAKAQGRNQSSVSRQLQVAEEHFKKIYQELFEKTA